MEVDGRNFVVSELGSDDFGILVAMEKDNDPLRVERVDELADDVWLVAVLALDEEVLDRWIDRVGVGLDLDEIRREGLPLDCSQGPGWRRQR